MGSALPPPPSPPVCHCTAVRRAARGITHVYDRHLAASGLRITQYALLARLDAGGPVTIGAIAAAMGTDRTAMGRALRPLARAGLVTIGAGRDGRTRVLTLTPAGRAGLGAARPLWACAQADFEARYGAAETVALRAALIRVGGVA